MGDNVSHSWEPIADLHPDWGRLQPQELEALGQVWREQHQTIQDQGLLREFQDRLNREWAIETGIIERVDSLDRGTTRLLIEKGIDVWKRGL